MRVPSHAVTSGHSKGLADKPLIDKEIGEVLATHDETQRQALYRDILTRLHDEGGLSAYQLHLDDGGIKTGAG